MNDKGFSLGSSVTVFLMSSSTSIRSRLPIKSGTMCSSSSLVMEEPDDPSKNVKNALALSATVWEKLMKFGNGYLHILPERKIIYYFFSLMLFSMMKESDVPHLTFLTGKYSILNQVFVKLGWMWTIGVFAAYRLASLPIHTKSIPILGRLFVRFVATTFFFYIWCAVIFPMVEGATGACLNKRIKIDISKKECLKRDGFVYDSFDISGHSYLLTYCVLIMMEESKESLYFIQLARHLRRAEMAVTGSDKPLLDRSEAKSLETKFTLMAPLISLGYLCMCALCLLWDFMLIITTIYYHTFLEKVLGTILAICMWYLLYQRVLPL